MKKSEAIRKANNFEEVRKIEIQKVVEGFDMEQNNGKDRIFLVYISFHENKSP